MLSCAPRSVVKRLQTAFLHRCLLIHLCLHPPLPRSLERAEWRGCVHEGLLIKTEVLYVAPHADLRKYVFDISFRQVFVERIMR